VYRAVVILAAALLVGCAKSPSPPPAAVVPEEQPVAIELPEPPYDLNTYEGVVADVVANLDEESLALLRRTAKADLIQFHHGWGTTIRNYYRFWSNEALIRSCARRAGRDGSMHPDDASMVVMEGVWSVVRSRK
jgi:hypothetical protein